MKKRQRKKEYKKNRNRNVIVPLIPVKVNQKEKKEQLNEIEMLKNELEKQKNKGFFARLFGK